MLSRYFWIRSINRDSTNQGESMINAALVVGVPEQLGYIVKTGKVNKLVLAWIDFIHDNPHDGRIVYPQIRRLIAGFDEPMIQLRFTLKLFAVSKGNIRVCIGLENHKISGFFCYGFPIK